MIQMDRRTKKSLFNGKYFYFEDDKIGDGGYAIVYKGEESSTKKPVAIKKINSSNIHDDYMYSAIRTEIRILKHIKDEHIIKLEETKQSKTSIYMILEYADGGNLQSFLNVQKNLDEKKTIKYITQIVCGMGVLVKNGITHRDLKPANILIKDGKLKIADFGLSRFSQISQKMISKVGTSTYMAPQIIVHQPYTTKCDIWSLGIICYEMVAGPVPWNSQKKISLSEHIGKIRTFLQDNISFPPNCNISDQLKGFIRGCLKFDENERFGWTEVFLHKIFKGKFVKSIIKQQNFTPKFCLSRLRQSIHLQNINIEEMFKEMPNQLNLEAFRTITNAVDNEITEKQADALYDYIWGTKKQISKEQLTEVLKKNGIKLIGQSIQRLNEISGRFQTSKNVGKYLQNLSKKLHLNKFDLFEMFQQYNSNGLQAISPDKFNQIILKIDPQFPQQFLPDLFVVFDVNKDGKISYEQLYSQFCKIGQMIVIRNKNMMDSFRKMVYTKNKKPTDQMYVSCQ